MEIQKRTMNWLPRASMYEEMEAAREKRRAYIESDLATSANLNSSFIQANTATTGDAINLTLQIAATRIQNGTTKKV